MLNTKQSTLSPKGDTLSFSDILLIKPCPSTRQITDFGVEYTAWEKDTPKVYGKSQENRLNGPSKSGEAKGAACHQSLLDSGVIPYYQLD